MSKTLNLADLKNPTKEQDDAPDKANFIAEPLTVTVTRPDGEVVLTQVLEPRGFNAKVDKRSGRNQGGIGWYGSGKHSEETPMEYKGLGLNTGLRISVDGVKVEPGTTVNLLGE